MCWSCKSNTNINYSSGPLIQLEFCWWLVYGAQLSRQQFEGSHLLSIRNTTEAERRANKNRQIFRTLNLCLDIFLNVHVQQMSLSAVKHEALCSSSSIPFSNSLRVTTKKPRQNILYHSSYPECFTAIVKFLEIRKKREDDWLCSWSKWIQMHGCDYNNRSGYW